ncbi:MAG: hypothetical protein BWY21_00366 [Parcubacteria group bacterium ADurb.Bin216]|nr:MAG: hypothetical protein BWY21_00366 [Parcubacteria group bacterium ADurb.Bin216]
MARGKEELKKIIQETKQAYLLEFGEKFYYDGLIKEVFEKLLKEKLRAFILKRLGHLPYVDYLALTKELASDFEIKIEPVAEVLKEKFAMSLSDDRRPRKNGKKKEAGEG